VKARSSKLVTHTHEDSVTKPTKHSPSLLGEGMGRGVKGNNGGRLAQSTLYTSWNYHDETTNVCQ
jgi:hypothetical protein